MESAFHCAIYGASMSYIERNLINDEHIIYKAKLHWIVFLWPVIFLMITISLFGDEETSKAGPGFLLITLLFSIASYINYNTSEFGITNRRVIVKQGLIRINTIEVFLDKIESISVYQSVTGRALGFGTIVVNGTGGIRDPFYKISQPLEFRKAAHEQIASVNS